MKRFSCQIKNTFLTLALAVAISACVRRPPSRPNVVFVYADDLGKGMLSFYGQKIIETPNIDCLLQQGVSFENACGCAYSAPSRASLLTGFSDVRTDKWKISDGARYFDVKSLQDAELIEHQIDESDVLLPDDDFYLPQIFQRAGYVTAQIGKLDYGFAATRHRMDRMGWDYYYGYFDHVRCHGFYPPFLWENGEIIPIEGNTLRNCGKSIEMETLETYAERWNMEGKKQYSQNLFMQKTLQFIEDHKDEPFFLMHATQLPHGPVSIPEVNSLVANDPNLTQIEKEYASMVLMLDDNVGEIIDKLEQLGLMENTIIVFASDNGHEIYYTQQGRIVKPVQNMQTGETFDSFERKYYSDLGGDVFNGNASMAGLKWSNLQGGINVPLTFYCPAQLKPKVIKDVVALYDLLPTFADWLSVPLLVEKDGVSLKDLVLEEKHLSPSRCVVVASSTGPAIIRNNGYKLRYFEPAGVYELFYLWNDYQERNSLVDVEKPVFQAMMKSMDSIVKQ